MRWDDYTPVTRDEADRIMAEVARDTATPKRFVEAWAIRPQSVVDAEGDHADTERLTAREKAQLRGWNIDCELTPGNPHPFGAVCKDMKCPCRGRSVLHYRRGI